MRLRSSFYAPPGGRWFYTVPQTKRYFESTLSLKDVERQVVSHLEVAGYPVPSNLPSLIEEAMCRALPRGSCLGDNESGVRRPTFFQVVEASNRFFRGKTFVEAREAERRAAICRKCEGSSLALCLGCTDLRKLISSSVGGRSTSCDPFLGVCVYQSVPAFGLVWCNGVPKVDDLPPNCWIGEAHA